jgi:hypothetical protein
MILIPDHIPVATIDTVSGTPQGENHQVIPREEQRLAFASYSRKRDLFARETAELLTREGYAALLDTDFMTMGGIVPQLAPRIKKAQLFVGLCTVEANASKFCRLEHDIAFAAGVPNIPILIDPLNEMDYFEGYYSMHNYIDVSWCKTQEEAWFQIELLLPRMIRNGRTSNF